MATASDLGAQPPRPPPAGDSILCQPPSPLLSIMSQSSPESIYRCNLKHYLPT